MNVVLSVDEAETVLTLVSGRLLDTATLSKAGTEAIREWRRQYVPGSDELDAFALALNDAIGAHIDERTTRIDRKSTRLNSSHIQKSRMPSSA